MFIYFLLYYFKKMEHNWFFNQATICLYTDFTESTAIFTLLVIYFIFLETI